MSILLTLGFMSVIILLSLLIEVWDDHQKEKIEEERHIHNIEEFVCEGYNDIIEDADRFGNEFYTSLNEFANKMDKLTKEDVKVHLKPYDIYEVKMLYEDPRCNILGRIVIDKNLNPKFMTSAPSLNREQADIELNVAYSLEAVKTLAETCRNIKMNIDIERYRKEKVNNAINGKK